MNEHNCVFGIVEAVDSPEMGVFGVLAKIDTGAYSGALHCSNIYVERTDTGSKLFYQPANSETILESSSYLASYVRSASGHRSKRYIIDTSIVIRGTSYPIRLGLSNRDDMSYEMIIGRRFLNRHGIIVDTRVNQHLDVDRKKKI
jgi:hypothetical protein